MKTIKKIAFAAIAAAACMTTAAQGQYKYETADFYIEASCRSDIRIGVKGDARLASPKGAKMEVNVYDKSTSPSGYSAMRKEVCDPDFVINDTKTEMMVEDKGEGRELLNALWWVNTDAVFEVSLRDSTAANGLKTVEFVLPSAERKNFIRAVK